MTATIDQVLLSSEKHSISAERRLELVCALLEQGAKKLDRGEEVLPADKLAASYRGLAALKEASDSDIEYWARNVKLGEEKGWTKTLWGKWLEEDKAAKAEAEKAAEKAAELAGMVAVDCPFSRKDKFKRNFPSARWDATCRTWRVPAADAERAAEWLS